MNLITNTALTMSSAEIADLVGSRHDNVKTAIDRLVARRVISQPAMQDGPRSANGVVVQEYLLIKRDSFVVVAQLSPEFTAALVDRWQQLEQQVSRPMTPVELIAASANQLLQIERRQAEQREALAQVESRVAQVEHTRFFDSVPAGFESITSLRARIGVRHGVPAWVINEVMRALPYCPRPYGFVKSKHSDEGGKPYPVYPVADITRLFDRFVSECTYETEQFATHPDIQQGRFKLCRRKAL